MANRTLVDTDGRTWSCSSDDDAGTARGQDVVVTCTTDSLPEPVRVTVGWQWQEMSDHGLARIISQAAPNARA